MSKIIKRIETKQIGKDSVVFTLTSRGITVELVENDMDFVAGKFVEKREVIGKSFIFYNTDCDELIELFEKFKGTNR